MCLCNITHFCCWHSYHGFADFYIYIFHELECYDHHWRKYHAYHCNTWYHRCENWNVKPRRLFQFGSSYLQLSPTETPKKSVENIIVENGMSEEIEKAPQTPPAIPGDAPNPAPAITEDVASVTKVRFNVTLYQLYFYFRIEFSQFFLMMIAN